MQQNESTAHTVPAQALQAGLIAVPSVHSECSHVGLPQKPWLHCPLQHCEGSMHGLPSCSHAFWQTPPWQEPEQQSSGKLQNAPFGWQGPPQTPRSQMPEQQSAGFEQIFPFGTQPPQTPPLH
jgi:hypothetical protein